VPKLRLTREKIEALDVPAHGDRGATRQAIYYDTEQPGLAVRVTSGGSRVFIAEAWPSGRTVRVKLGRVSDLTLTQARMRAKVVTGEMAAGINPNAKKRIERARSITFGQALEEYIATRKAAKRLAARTEYDFRRLAYGARDRAGNHLFNGYLSPWRNTPLSHITTDMVLRRHAEILERSGAQANYSMRIVSTVYKFARAKHRADGAGEAPLGENPVKILGELKAWCHIERRSTLIHPHQLPAWFAAVRQLHSRSNYNFASVARIYFQFLVLTGLRRGEAARLRWADVDLQGRFFTVRDTKNGTDHMLPLSDYTVELLEERRRDAELEDLTPAQRGYVFPGGGREGYLVEPKKLVALVRESSGLMFTLHDLRRTFATIADSLEISSYALKRLLNHKQTDDDVTGGYIGRSSERLRAPMQKITDFILRAAGLRESAAVLPLREASAHHG
jgi:integrase